jgi:serine/threonine protein kinase
MHKADSLTERLRRHHAESDQSYAADSSTLPLAGSGTFRSFRLPGSIDERYDAIEVLGKGAFGIVFQARDTRIGRLTAIKQLFRQHRSVPEISERFLQEARIAGQLEHPNIVTIYDVAGNREQFCIVMEYLCGGSLACLLDDEGTLSQKRSLRILRGILSGLDAAHSMRVIHRDIKPRNILFDHKGEPKIGDFGVAHLPIDAGGILFDDDSVPAGTPDYMAPEQVVYGTSVDVRSDLFSAGVIFLEMLSGERVYEFTGSRNFKDISQVIRNTEMPNFSTVLTGCSDAVIEIAEGLVRRDPDTRFASASVALDLVDSELRKYTRGQVAATRAVRRVEPDSPENVDMFEDILRLFLVDGVVSGPERRELTRRAERLGISDVTSQAIEDRIRAEMDLPLLHELEQFRTRVAETVRNGRISAEDRVGLTAYADKVGISTDEQRWIIDTIRAATSE